MKYSFTYVFHLRDLCWRKRWRQTFSETKNLKTIFILNVGTSISLWQFEEIYSQYKRSDKKFLKLKSTFKSAWCFPLLTCASLGDLNEEKDFSKTIANILFLLFKFQRNYGWEVVPSLKKLFMNSKSAKQRLFLGNRKDLFIFSKALLLCDIYFKISKLAFKNIFSTCDFKEIFSHKCTIWVFILKITSIGKQKRIILFCSDGSIFDSKF